MSSSVETEFYMRREHQERRLAETTRNPEGRRVHLDLANRYASLIAGAEPDGGPTRRL